MHFWWTPAFVSAELFKVNKYSKTIRKVLNEFLKLTAEPKVLEN